MGSSDARQEEYGVISVVGLARAHANQVAAVTSTECPKIGMLEEGRAGGFCNRFVMAALPAANKLAVGQGGLGPDSRCRRKESDGGAKSNG